MSAFCLCLETTDAVLDGEAGVFGGLEAFENELHFGELAVFGDGGPGLGGVVNREVFVLEALEHGHHAAALFALFGDGMAGGAGA